MGSDWPPISVGLLAGAVIGPAVGLVGRAALAGDDGGRHFAYCLLVVAGGAGVLLFTGDRTTLALAGLAAVAVGLAGVAAAWIALTTGEAEPALSAVALLSWAVAVLVLRHWPATRCWCGLLPVAEEEDDGA